MHVPHSMSGRSTRGRASCQTVKKKTLASLGQCDCGYRVQTVRLEGWHSFRMSCGALEHVNVIDLPMLSSITNKFSYRSDSSNSATYFSIRHHILMLPNATASTYFQSRHHILMPLLRHARDFSSPPLRFGIPLMPRHIGLWSRCHL